MPDRIFVVLECDDRPTITMNIPFRSSEVDGEIMDMAAFMDRIMAQTLAGDPVSLHLEAPPVNLVQGKPDA